MNPNQKHSSCKKSCGQDLKKGCDEKDVKSKGGSQGLCRNAVDHIKKFDNDDPSLLMESLYVVTANNINAFKSRLHKKAEAKCFVARVIIGVSQDTSYPGDSKYYRKNENCNRHKLLIS